MVIDLFCGRGGWTKGFLAEGYQAIGFDVERHSVYPGELVLQDVATLGGRQFRGASVIVASPPCQRYSYMAMPWDRAKREIRWQEWERDSPFSTGFDLNDLYNHCFRIAREAGCPLVVENVKGAQRWVGRAAWHYGSFYLWGDVPALMPSTAHRKVPGMNFHEHEKTGKPGRSFQSAAVDHIKNSGGSWFNQAHNTESGTGQNPDGRKVAGISFSGYGKAGYKAQGFNVTAAQRYREEQGIKQPGHSGRAWFADHDVAGHFSSKPDSRKAASAAIAEIPFDLAQWIARCFKP